jgi:S-DNA-T family DNA segregation ATPase FtsK/SpoIIIE
MNNNELIGRVAASYLAIQLDQSDASTTARYVIDSLSADQTAAVAKAILSNANLASRIELKLPDQWLADYGLPPECLTDQRATHLRNVECAKPAMLVATPGDDERASLADLMVIDTILLRSQVDLWVQEASAGLPITDQQRRIWIAALHGLHDVAQVTLDAFAKYVLQVSLEIDQGNAFPDVMGTALPLLQWPRNPAIFRSLNEKTINQPSRWKQLFTTVQKRQACYLKKYTPNNQVLSADELSSSFEKVKDVIPEPLHTAIRAFIAAPSKWNPEAAALAQIDWELITPLFDGLRPEPFNIGRATLEFFDEQGADSLTAEERAHLQGLATRRSSQASPEDSDFYRAHRIDLKDNPKLKSKWDKFVFGMPVETTDFLQGLALCLESLFDQNLPENSTRHLQIISDKRTKADLRKLNIEAGKYFVFRYRGIRDLLGPRHFDVGELFSFDRIHEAWLKDDQEGRRKYKPNDSTSRAALEIKFYVHLTVNDGEIENHRQLIWRFNPSAIASELISDWARLVDHPFALCEVAREPVGPKGQAQALDLHEVRSLSAAFGQDRGSLVRSYRKEHDLATSWSDNVSTLVSQGSLTPELGAELEGLFQDFAKAYAAAIDEFPKASVATAAIKEQYIKYGALLHAVTHKARGDRLRDLLLKPLLAIGVVAVIGTAPAAIVAPWNPVRMRALVAKATRLCALIHHLLSAPSVLFGDPALFFKEMKDDLEHPYYPELALGWRERKSELLGVTDSLLDYTLHELPLRGTSQESETNENSQQTANQIVEMVQRYLALFPHERANLSIVLYNCDSASLPQAVVNRINELHEEDEEMRCEVVLRHRDKDKLHRLYEQILEAYDADTDGFIASEASRDFMARLRIGILADEAPAPDDKDGPSRDIVFLHDVISRHAVLEWYREEAIPVSVDQLVPARWSRRRPSPKDEEKSIVYLTCPVQSQEGWAYLTAITSFFRPDWHEDLSRRYLPARQLDFHDPTTSKIFEETHHLGNWVVNFDELLDRRQLVNQGVRVIQYKQSASQGRNLLVSSNASLGLLQTMLISRIKDLAPELSDARLRDLAKRFIDDANLISGDLVLRAAKRGRNASELLGVVLSYWLVKQELGSSARLGCYFLDDYAEWLGEAGQQIADLLIISPEILPGGARQLSIIVTESKYIGDAALSAKRKESQKQLRDSMGRIRQALFSDPPRLDRDLWLARFSDLLLAGIPYTAGDPIDLVGFRRAVRDGTCNVFLRGYSHIFVSNPEANDESDFVEVAECPGAYQECYSRAKTRLLLLAYEGHASADPVRFSVAEQRIIQSRDFRAIGAEPTIPPPKPRTPKKGGGGSPPSDDGPKAPSSPSGPVNSSATASARTEDGGVNSQPDAAPRPPVVQATAEKAPTTWSYAGVAAILDARITSATVTEAEATWLRDTVIATRTALQQFQLHSKVVGEPILTPNAAIIRFQGATNMTVEQVLKRRSEMLTTHALNVISVRPEPGVVSISIARPQRQTLHTLDVWKRWTPETTAGNHRLLVAVQEGDSSLLFVSPTENAPHTLIAGATGSGKSVLMQNIILAIACTNTPAQARIELIDPKMGVDYFAFEGLPHLGGGIIEEQSMAIQRLNYLLVEMDRRYTVLRQNRCANIFELNRKPGATERLPCLWVIHDEFAEWMMTEDYAATVSDVVSRLGVKARAAGIFLIFAAQRPDNQVMPMQLRSNLGNRLILRVDSEGTSEIALGGDRGAERLLGRGHMVAKLEGLPGLVYAQVPMITAEDIARLVSVIRVGNWETTDTIKTPGTD